MVRAVGYFSGTAAQFDERTILTAITLGPWEMAFSKVNVGPTTTIVFR